MATIGIDIGGTNTKLGWVREDGECLAQRHFATQGHASFEAYLLHLAEEVKALQAEFPAESCRGIGIGAPNGNYYRGTIEHAPNLEWKGILPLASELQVRTGSSVTLSNDANAAALGEMKYGAAKGKKHFIALTLGTGLGSGIVVDGKLLYGHDGFAGELGHWNVEAGGRACGCGREGCLERYVSATGLVITANEWKNYRNNSSSLRFIPDAQMTAEKVYQAALQGDLVALDIFDYTARTLAFKLADAVSFSSPEMIILSGGMMQAGDFLLKPLQLYLEKYLMPIFRNKVSIQYSTLAPNLVGILGAAALVE